MIIQTHIRMSHINKRLSRQGTPASNHGDWHIGEDTMAEEPSQGMTMDAAADHLLEMIHTWEVGDIADLRAIKIDLEDGTARIITEDLLRHTFQRWLDQGNDAYDAPDIFEWVNGSYMRREVDEGPRRPQDDHALL